MKKILFISFLSVHLFVILYNNIIVEEQAINKCLLNKLEDGIALNALHKSSVTTKLFTAYSKYTGTETGYGFYAPNVSSPVVLMLTKFDVNGRLISVESPAFSSRDAMVRFNTSLDLFLDKVQNRDSKYNKYMNLVLRSIVMWTMQNDTNCKKVFADILIYDLNKNSIAKPSYLKLGHYEYTSIESLAKN